MATRNDGLVDRVTDRLDDLRDSTAGALSADDAPSLRELGRVRRRLDDFEDQMTDSLSALESQQSGLASELRAGNKRTTVPRKLFWMLLGGVAAALGTWLADPDRGKARRTQLADQAKTQARQVGDQARTQAQQAVNTARGTVTEAVTDALPDDVPDDPVVLQDRIKSQVFGHRDDVSDVVLTVGKPGHVTLKGTIGSAEAERDLTDAVRGVNGVVDVQSELNTTS